MKNMRFLAAPVLLTGLLMPSVVLAEVLELEAPVWEEVPGTYDPNTDEQWAEPVYVDVNSFVDDGEILTFDMVDSASKYVRMQVDCDTSEYRPIRLGDFESQTLVTYREVDFAWDIASENNDSGAIVRFVCAM